MKPKLEFMWDENLREVPRDPVALRQHVLSLHTELYEIDKPVDRVQVLGELGVYLRILGKLEDAESKIQEALRIIYENNLGIRWEIQQKIRLANVLQWKKAFSQSNLIFAEVIETCRTNIDAEPYLDFALQHGGKNYFDQMKLVEALSFFEEALKLRQMKHAPSDQIDSTIISIKRTKQRLSNFEP